MQVVSDKGPLAGAIQSKNKIKGLLRVTVVEARNLPAMDLFRSTDAYCLVFLSEPYGESVTGAGTHSQKYSQKYPPLSFTRQLY